MRLLPALVLIAVLAASPAAVAADDAALIDQLVTGSPWKGENIGERVAAIGQAARRVEIAVRPQRCGQPDDEGDRDPADENERDDRERQTPPLPVLGRDLADGLWAVASPARLRPGA